MAQRDLLLNIWRNFVKSIRPRQFNGRYMGSDLFDNKYYEIPADPANGRRKAARYFEPKIKDDFESEKSAEWESWLRGRRADPPTEMEQLRNRALAEMKQQKASELAGGKSSGDKAKDVEIKQEVRGYESFPNYGDEYEVSAGYKKPK